MTDRALAIPEQSGMSQLLEEEKPLALGYTDKDYYPAPKFYKDDVLATVSELRADHSVRIAQAKEYAHFLDCGSPGYFKEDEQMIEDDLIEVMPLLGAREDYEMRVGFLATHDAYPRLLNRDLIDRDEAIVVEDLATFYFQCEERQYQRRHRSDLRLAEAAHLLRYGMLVGLDVLDPDDKYCGLAMDLLDPLTVFPVWGGQDGLLECYRVFEATNEEIIGTYGGRPGTKEYKRVREKVEATASMTKRGRKNFMVRNQKRTVTECYSYDEFYVILDSEVELVRRTHGYRDVPISIQCGGFDQPIGVSVGTMWENMREPRLMKSQWGDITVSSQSMDIARQLRPFAWRHVWAHRIAEAVAGRQLTMFKWALDPHKILEFDPSTGFMMADEVDLVPGETTKLPIPNKLSLFTPVIDVNAAAGLAANLQANMGGSFITQMRLGAIPPQTSGSALGKLQAMGGTGEVTLVRNLQAFKQMRTERRLKFNKIFGDSIGAPLGVVRAPSRYGYGTPVHMVTPDLLERTGCDIDIELYQWAPDVPLAQYIATLRTPSPTTGKPLISDQTAQRKLKFVVDVDREADRIDDEALAALPPVQQQRHIARLERDLDEATSAGDHESAADIMIAIAELQFLHDMAVMEGTAAPPPMEGAPPGSASAQIPKPAPAPAATAPALPGNSLTDMNIGVGNQGGAPTGGGSGPRQPLAQLTPIGGGGGQ